MAELRKGKWYIERYDFHTGHRDYWNALTEEFVWYRRDATSYETMYLAQKAFEYEGFKKTERYNYHVQFHDEK